MLLHILICKKQHLLRKYLLQLYSNCCYTEEWQNIMVLVREERSYVKETLHQNGYPERFLLLSQHSPSRKDEEEKNDPRSHITISYIQGVSEAVTRILSNIDVQVHMKPFRTLRKILSYPKDHIPDDDKSSIVYKINCCDCDASYVG